MLGSIFTKSKKIVRKVKLFVQTITYGGKVTKSYINTRVR